MGVWSHLMDWFGLAPRRPLPPREDARRAGQVYQSIQRANCAADQADRLSRDVLDQEAARFELDMIDRDLNRERRPDDG